MVRQSVVICEYNPQWPALYEEECKLILEGIGQYVAAVEHVGSTAVPGLAAKPIIDIMVAIHDLSQAWVCIEPLGLIGYEYVPEFEAELPDRRYFRKGPADARTHHLHMVKHATAFWIRHLLFRDYLRDHPEEASRYGELKKELAAKFGTDRDGYTVAKTEFITSCEQKARAERAGSTTLPQQP